jgi:type IV pilus assembly protein PilP
MESFTRNMLLASALLLAVGCGEEPAPAPARVAPTFTTPTAEKVAVDETAAAPLNYVYSPNGMRDPFRAPGMEVRRSTEAEPETTCRRPICKFDIDELSLVAIVTGGPNPVAMVRDPQGRGFNVRRNSPIGSKGGRVTAIRSDEITITEYWSAPDGTKNPNRVSLKLRPEEKSTPVVDLATGAEYR